MRLALLLLLAAAPLLHAEDDVPGLKSQVITLNFFDREHKADPIKAVQFRLVRLPPGKITLPVPDAPKTHIIKPIWMMTTEVRWDEFDIFWMYRDLPESRRRQVDGKSRPSMPYEATDCGWGLHNYPAMKISLQAARQYCEWMSQQTGKKFRLPTEAEWEYACRANGDLNMIPLDNEKADKKRLDRVAWFEDNAEEKTHEVATKQPNSWGLYDMLGNVAEWVTTENGAAVAGGSFQDERKDITPSAREEYSPNWQKRDPQLPKGRSWLSDAPHVGLRLVMED